uniref:Fatty acyl-CoA reductase n=1 Tax=Chenopodium quinoa TaxID=63459 RepID=A0A803MK15_CHEQI
MCDVWHATVFVEKLLREVPEVQKIIDTDLFKRLKEVHGEKYEEFMKNKLIPVIENLSEPCLGMDANVAVDIANKVDVIINAAGSTGWQGRYDTLLDVNVQGISGLIGFKKSCKKRSLFLHVSTAFVTKKTVGVFMETPIGVEEGLPEGQNWNSQTLDIEAEFKLAAKIASEIPKNELSAEMAKLGLRRAKFHGWTNTYQLTKAMGEMLLTKVSDKLPVIIIRPTLVESIYSDPFPGWIEGYRGIEPIIVSYGKGQLQGILADPTAIVDIVPVDMVVNAMIAAIANHGIIGEPELEIYHVTSSMVNPLTCGKLIKLCNNYFALHPFITPSREFIKVKDIEFFSSIDEYIFFGMGSSSSNDKLHRILVRMAAIYQPVLFSKLRVNDKKTQILMEKMSSVEKKIFDFDVKRIILEDYLMNTHFTDMARLSMSFVALLVL